MSELAALSPHVAHVLETESPLHAWTYHRRLGGKPKPSTSPQALGTIMHNLFLEGGDRVVALEHLDYKTKAAKQARAEVLGAGLFPCLSEKLVEARICVDRWTEHLARIRINGAPFSFAGGTVESLLSWEEQGTLCHGRPDWVSKDRALILDLKTTGGSVAPEMCAASMLRSAGVIQDHAYRSAIELDEPELAGRVNAVFLFAQVVEPYALTPIMCGATMREIGCGRWRRSLATWATCLRTNQWPPFTTVPIYVEAPGWALHREMTEGEMG